ncbi:MULTISPECIES: DUF1120 domain-containing protein [Pseudomonas]|uniref:DUF1120 domain-containing protein n=1 Tax=Pseudomonas azadiae TaxID=2843612 RepID=A0ABS6NS81_9PSED|nr:MULTISPECIES: DUF1120 domain-containing protein [Pseudomonas]MBV4451077.1 DUF1120 domain-containing protein [Pseudomonas azadiae]NMF40302.1 DUF1120 domain-containing protein [Pseudomonas sp. SWRI 103]
MRTTLITLTAALLAAGSSAAFAASSVDLSVKGVITPSACTPGLSNGGLADIGKLSAKDLNVDQLTRLEELTLQLTVTCDGSTLMALESRDNRLGSEYDNRGNFGLGLINGTEKLGSMELELLSAVADGGPVKIIDSSDSGAHWIFNSWLMHGGLKSVTNTEIAAPTPVQLLTADLRILPLIAPTNTLTLTNEVPIDGSITMTVWYL